MVVGPPPWADLAGHPCIRFACWEAVCAVSHPWIVRTLTDLRADFPADHLIDVRVWPWLPVGAVPGSTVGKHRDITRPGGRHRLCVIGAGSVPWFEDGRVVTEGVPTDYSTELHEAGPALYAGPRLMLRLTQPGCRPLNKITAPYHHTPKETDQ